MMASQETSQRDFFPKQAVILFLLCSLLSVSVAGGRFHREKSFPAEKADYGRNVHFPERYGSDSDSRRQWKALKRLSEGELGDSFKLTFTNRTEVLKYFEEGDGHLTTGGSSACERPDHLFYDTFLPDCNCHGLKIKMDNKNATCSRDVQISTGHLASLQYYSYGEFEVRARIAHSLSGSDPPKNAFTCFSAYLGAAESKVHYHNEIALCWPGSDTRQLHMGYWYGRDGDRMHLTKHDLSFNAAESYHTYKFKWSNESITFMVDGDVVHKVTGTADTLPFQPLSIRVILRPENRPSVYEGEAAYDLVYVSYTAA